MKNRASLVFMEQLVMLLVFALCAAICLKVFAASRAQAEQARHIDHAVLIAQNMAERLKLSGGELESFSEDGYHVQISPLESGVPGLGRAELRVSYEGAELVVLETAWQEGAG